MAKAGRITAVRQGYRPHGSWPPHPQTPQQNRKPHPTWQLRAGVPIPLWSVSPLLAMQPKGQEAPERQASATGMAWQQAGVTTPSQGGVCEDSRGE